MRTRQIRFLREKLRLLERELNDPFGQDSGCCGLTLAQCHTLLEVGNRGRVSLVDLASGFGLDTSTLSRMIQGLVVLGLVSRLPDEKDRRYVAISLTDRGRELYDRIETTFDAYFEEVMELVPAGKREAVVESIGLFSDAVRKYGEADHRCGLDAGPAPGARNQE
jgi:DNA-binding MarR family transcriptional regulator